MEHENNTFLLKKNKTLQYVTFGITGLVVLIVLGLHLMTFLNTQGTTRINEQTSQVKESITKLEQTKGFREFDINNSIVAKLKVIPVSRYIDEIYSSIAGEATIRSIQMSEATTEKNRVEFQIAFESEPPLSTLAKVYDVFAENSSFEIPSFSAVSLSRDIEGNTVYSYPITLPVSQNENGTHAQ